MVGVRSRRPSGGPRRPGKAHGCHWGASLRPPETGPTNLKTHTCCRALLSDSVKVSGSSSLRRSLTPQAQPISARDVSLGLAVQTLGGGKTQIRPPARGRPDPSEPRCFTVKFLPGLACTCARARGVGPSEIEVRRGQVAPCNFPWDGCHGAVTRASMFFVRYCAVTIVSMFSLCSHSCEHLSSGAERARARDRASLCALRDKKSRVVPVLERYKQN